MKLSVRPVPSPRPRVYRDTTIMPKKYKEHKQFIALKARNFKAFDNVPLAVKISCFFKPSKTASKNKYSMPRGDVDNYAKTYLDALEGVLYENDTQVEELTVIKKYATADAVFIEIKELC